MSLVSKTEIMEHASVVLTRVIDNLLQNNPAGVYMIVIPDVVYNIELQEFSLLSCEYGALTAADINEFEERCKVFGRRGKQSDFLTTHNTRQYTIIFDYVGKTTIFNQNFGCHGFYDNDNGIVFE